MDKFKKIFLFLLELEEQTHVHLKIKKFQKWLTWKIPWFTPTLINWVILSYQHKSLENNFGLQEITEVNLIKSLRNQYE